MSPESFTLMDFARLIRVSADQVEFAPEVVGNEPRYLIQIIRALAHFLELLAAELERQSKRVAQPAANDTPCELDSTHAAQIGAKGGKARSPRHPRP